MLQTAQIPGSWGHLNSNKIAIPGGEVSLTEADNSLSYGGRESEEEHIGDRRDQEQTTDATYPDGEVERERGEGKKCSS